MLRHALWIASLGAACGEATTTSEVADELQHLDTGVPVLPRTFRPVMTATPAGMSPGVPQLLTDGSVLIPDISSMGNGRWWRLVPDHTGSYEHGTWVQAASSANYAPLYFGSATLPDGRVIVEGGEYLDLNPTWTTKGAIYDPVADMWKAVSPPEAFTTTIGDASGIVLADGTYMQSDCCSSKGMALLDPVSLTWTSPVGDGKADLNDEESWAALPDGRILTVDANAPGGDLLHTEVYDPATTHWTDAGQVPVKIADTVVGDPNSSHEVGPELLRDDGTVVAIGGTGHNAVYDIATATWSALPDLPDGNQSSDGPGVVMPNGTIMIAASPGVFQPPTTYFELDGSTFTKLDSQPPHGPSNPSYSNFFLMLPTGEVLITDFTSDVELYTPAPGVVEHARPIILGAPQLITASPEPQTATSTLYRGRSYTLPVQRMNGLNFGAYYGDDAQMSTNFPLVRVTNHDSGDVAFLRTYAHSNRSIAPDASGTTKLDVPATAETGLADLVVIANGIASPPITVNVK